MPTKLKPAVQNRQCGEAKRRRKAEDYAVVIKRKEGSTYADLLKQVKDNVDISGVEVKVRSVRQIRTEDLLIEVGKGLGETRKLKAVLVGKLPELAGIRILIRQQRKRRCSKGLREKRRK